MFRSSSMAPSYVLLFSVLLLSIFSKMVAQPREILIDDEAPMLKTEKHDEYGNEENLEEAFEHAPCHMEYQVMKRVVGTCIRMGRSARGCVAGNYLQPFHPECI